MEKCYYCNKPAENKKYFFSHTMYQVISINKFIAGYKYNSKEILVPRCKSCCKKTHKFLFNILLFLRLLLRY
jgi:hypothetical protein